MTSLASYSPNQQKHSCQAYLSDSTNSDVSIDKSLL